MLVFSEECPQMGAQMGPQKGTQKGARMGPQMGPQIIIFDNFITSSFAGTKTQIHILHGCDLSLYQISMSENALFSMLTSDPEESKFHVL